MSASSNEDSPWLSLPIKFDRQLPRRRSLGLKTLPLEMKDPNFQPQVNITMPDGSSVDVTDLAAAGASACEFELFSVHGYGADKPVFLSVASSSDYISFLELEDVGSALPNPSLGPSDGEDNHPHLWTPSVDSRFAQQLLLTAEELSPPCKYRSEEWAHHHNGAQMQMKDTLATRAFFSPSFSTVSGEGIQIDCGTNEPQPPIAGSAEQVVYGLTGYADGTKQQPVRRRISFPRRRASSPRDASICREEPALVRQPSAPGADLADSGDFSLFNPPRLRSWQPLSQRDGTEASETAVERGAGGELDELSDAPTALHVSHPEAGRAAADSDVDWRPPLPQPPVCVSTGSGHWLRGSHRDGSGCGGCGRGSGRIYDTTTTAAATRLIAAAAASSSPLPPPRRRMLAEWPPPPRATTPQESLPSAGCGGAAGARGVYALLSPRYAPPPPPVAAAASPRVLATRVQTLRTRVRPARPYESQSDLCCPGGGGRLTSSTSPSPPPPLALQCDSDAGGGDAAFAALCALTAGRAGL